MLKLLRFASKQQWLYAIGVLVFVVISVWCTLTMPDYMTEITTLVETGGEMSAVWIAGAKMLAFALGDALCSIVVSFLTARIGAGFGATLRSKIYNKVVSFSQQDINSFSTASLVTRSTNDITQVLMVIVIGLQMILRAPIIAVWAFIKILDKGWQWLLVTGISIVIVVCVIAVILIVCTPKFRLIQKLTDNLNRITRENLLGVRVVRAFNAEKYQEDKFDTANKDITDNHLFTGKTMAILMPTIQLVMSGTSLVIYWVGAYLIANAVVGADRVALFSNLVVFMAYAIQIIMAFMMVSMIFIFLPRARVAAGRIWEVLNIEESILDGAKTDSEGVEGKVEFKDVSFKYPDAEEYILKDINFTVEKGQTIAFIGSTGSGKSTVVNLIPRFYDVTEGEVLVDGVNVKDYTQKALHNKIGYVSQKAILFKGTIASNINYGDENGEERSDEDIIHALEIAQGREIIEGEEKGIYAEVAQGGTNFSGGQKQRIAIARAICRRPEIYIFDDSFSALDYRTDKVLRAKLAEETKEATKIIVAQRIGTIMDADIIIVLDEGRMVGIGTHKELLGSCEVYQQIALSQLSKEELDNAR